MPTITRMRVSTLICTCTHARGHAPAPELTNARPRKLASARRHEGAKPQMDVVPGRFLEGHLGVACKVAARSPRGPRRAAARPPGPQCLNGGTPFRYAPDDPSRGGAGWPPSAGAPTARCQIPNTNGLYLGQGGKG
eukprot:7007533-Alexandrium_andersonii.AAC.1